MEDNNTAMADADAATFLTWFFLSTDLLSTLFAHHLVAAGGLSSDTEDSLCFGKLFKSKDVLARLRTGDCGRTEDGVRLIAPTGLGIALTIVYALVAAD